MWEVPTTAARPCSFCSNSGHLPSGLFFFSFLQTTLKGYTFILRQLPLPKDVAPVTTLDGANMEQETVTCYRNPGFESLLHHL